ncbi:helix-turn-helix transcriptional regulator [Anoxybacillus flavithermus]|uniref:helix-turn-helix domain-containing protein n=1 Tax=Anoxybacillus flavithermus TaxID=33934 RepID=UPI001867DD1E|nr:helix-turn-helix transcriptional regulator [Anoxybacillus flavithermus]MBE2950174.1 helix-turn-helix transcriptional regulator [Anoxybacillus flavithermus]MBE2953029.1 helix-turn-helix transcriptional regulator [Anoxybacillus flavithermus]MBE2958382.1 helix-turn-helix transcriptional regulator [Anoxybacillus flavithermus]
MKRKLGERIKEIRIQKGLTQSFVAKELGYKSPSMLSEIESGKKGIDAEKIPLLANILGVDINDIFFNEKIHDLRTNSA